MIIIHKEIQIKSNEPEKRKESSVLVAKQTNINKRIIEKVYSMCRTKLGNSIIIVHVSPTKKV